MCFFCFKLFWDLAIKLNLTQKQLSVFHIPLFRDFLTSQKELWLYQPAIVFHAHIYPCTSRYTIITANAINKIVLNGDLFFLFGLLLSISVMMINWLLWLLIYNINRQEWGMFCFSYRWYTYFTNNGVTPEISLDCNVFLIA